VAELRQAILQMAVRGKLVPQNPSDEPASVLLERISAERERQSKEGKSGKSKPRAPLRPKDVPFEVPEGWNWVYLGDVITDGPRNGFSPRPVEHETATRSLTLSATTSGTFDPSHFKYVDVTVDATSHLWLHPGDLLIQRGNSLDYVGIAAIYQGEPIAFIYPDLMMKLRVSTLVDVRYVHCVINSAYSRDYMRSQASGTSGSMPKVNQPAVTGLPLALPPLAEQRRIVEKVDQLMALCDELEAKLMRSRTKAEKLASAVVHHLTAA
jgi:type I restriction enzyme S subunit